MKVYTHVWDFLFFLSRQLDMKVFPQAEMNKKPTCACCFPIAVFTGLKT